MGFINHEYFRIMQQRRHDGDALTCAVRKPFEWPVHIISKVEAFD